MVPKKKDRTSHNREYMDASGFFGVAESFYIYIYSFLFFNVFALGLHLFLLGPAVCNMLPMTREPLGV